jgi:hypothetical protein
MTIPSKTKTTNKRKDKTISIVLTYIYEIMKVKESLHEKCEN